MTAIEDSVLYFHIPKTGGTSVATAVRGTFARGGAIGLYDVSVTASPSKQLLKRLSRLSRCRDVRFIHAHLSPAGLPSDLPLRRAVTLRDPLDRLLSHFCYCFEHRYADPEQFAFFSQPEYLGRTDFFAADVAVWARVFRADNYMTRFLIGRMSGRIVSGDADVAERELAKMTFIGFTDRLKDMLAQMARGLGVRHLPARHANSSDRTVVNISAQEGAELAREFLQVDLLVFERAKRLAMCSHGSLAASVAVAQPAIDDWILRLFFTLRHRTLREWQMAVGGRLAPLIRRAQERNLLFATKDPDFRRTANDESRSQSIDLAAE